ncbi:NAD(P)H-quinone oxidoreductase subunit k chloroplastic [Phtheirospermum japonicum]|uniref:NAD(P)H-quinone oxidoreductase subunit k chloroplastic n=1 Tax=Phtheirospermum japonicum TaxID=374723 RepID=A0A830AYL8_9LAMI|nr:NAD(P)H-quinone oxidoreductase subunit k chloroplastic [Phtheirospermum japonicum]
MPELKYVIAMGACTITGGVFSNDSYSTVRGVDKLIHVDVSTALLFLEDSMLYLVTIIILPLQPPDPVAHRHNT